MAVAVIIFCKNLVYNCSGLKDFLKIKSSMHASHMLAGFESFFIKTFPLRLWSTDSNFWCFFPPLADLSCKIFKTSIKASKVIKKKSFRKNVILWPWFLKSFRCRKLQIYSNRFVSDFSVHECVELRAKSTISRSSVFF